MAEGTRLMVVMVVVVVVVVGGDGGGGSGGCGGGDGDEPPRIDCAAVSITDSRGVPLHTEECLLAVCALAGSANASPSPPPLPPSHSPTSPP